ncbi:MAG: hypothetical protein HGA36_04755 [Candidatus Moranbacteria bacterium]|nr:hypothetical protein [Candidatus Moranbacteria bacterium]
MPDKNETIETFNATFTQLLNCPECGSRKFEFKPIEEEPSYISRPFAGFFECHGNCGKAFMISIDSPLIIFIKEMTGKLLLKNEIPTQTIKDILSKLN